MTDLEKARELLLQGNYTAALCRDGEVLTSTLRGVKPLLDWIDEGRKLTGWSAADRVVGKAAAFLYVLLGVERVWASVMSHRAAQVLRSHGIEALCDTEVEKIENRTHDGYCPMETAVWDIDDPVEARATVIVRLRELNGQ
ncbi:MAG: DUF1893 domain-containing protein [Clostridiales bacterium]|nr:DUF1893 domain-containing protein [Candidatus Apopatocola equi]